MNEFRLNVDAGVVSLKSKNQGYAFTKLSAETALEQMQILKYAQYCTEKEAFGDGEISIFVENDPFCLSFKSLLSYFPISVYLTLLSVYFFMFILPLKSQYPDMIQVYLNVLSGIVLSGDGQFSLSYFSMMVIWVVSSGFVSLLIVTPIYILLMRFLSVLPVVAYRLLYYKVLGLFVRTEPSQS